MRPPRSVTLWCCIYQLPAFFFCSLIDLGTELTIRSLIVMAKWYLRFSVENYGILVHFVTKFGK